MPFPNLQNKHAHDAMFSPHDFLKDKKKRGTYPSYKPPKGMIICYRKKLLEYIKENHAATKVEGFPGEMYLLNETGGTIGVIGGFGIGAPIAVTVLEELVAFGVQKFVSIGTAGTLQKNIAIGSILVCDKAIRDEGTSYHYLKSSKYAHASPKITANLQASLKKLKQTYSIGTSWTIDAPYRETVAEARHYQQEGVAAVEMEASALFAVAQYRKVELGALLTISDSLAELTWKPKFHIKKVANNLETLYKVALDALSN